MTYQDEVNEHRDETGHEVVYDEEFDLYSCRECVWVDSRYVPTQQE